MGLNIASKYSDEIEISYGTFGRYRCELMRAIDPHIGELYEEWYFHNLSDDDVLEDMYDWFSKHPAIENFMAAPDCEFKFTPKECRQIRDALRDAVPDGFTFECLDRMTHRSVNGKVLIDTMDLHARVMESLNDCVRHRVNLYGY